MPTAANVGRASRKKVCRFRNEGQGGTPAEAGGTARAHEVVVEDPARVALWPADKRAVSPEGQHRGEGPSVRYAARGQQQRRPVGLMLLAVMHHQQDMKRRTLRLAAAGAAAILALTTAACAGSATGSAGGAGASTLTIALIAEPNSLDPLQNFDGRPQMVYQLLAYEPLIKINQAGQLIPGLATKWGYVSGSDNTEFRLTIRQAPSSPTARR